MTPNAMKRKLSAILSADVKGYSRLMGDDEAATVRTLSAYREVMANLIREHRGRVVDSPGDNLLAEFGSVVDAVQCAVEVQRELKARNAELPPHRRMEFRIGINLGDVIVEGERIYGDGVNIAARLEGLAEGGGICISGTAYDQVEGKLPLGYAYMGEHAVKNIKKPVRVYGVLMEPVTAPPRVSAEKRTGLRHRRWAALAVAALLVGGAAVVALWNLNLRPAAPPEIAHEQTPSLELPDKPSIAVLPFENMSRDPEQEYFANGMTEDLITDLSKISGLFVIARNSVFTYKGKPVKVEKVSQELGVRYVLEGSVRKAGDRVRITAQLVDAKTGYHLWADRYDRELKDIFALQDEVTQKIVTALRVELTEGEQERLAHKFTDNLEAYDYYLRGLDQLMGFTKEKNARARELFEKTIEADPEYALGYVGLGWTYVDAWSMGWTHDPQSLVRAFELAQRAIALDDSLPEAYAILGNVYLWKKEHERAIVETERAIALDPNDADSYVLLGDILVWAGKPEEAIELTKKAMRFNPVYPAWYLWNVGHAYFLMGRHEEAIATHMRILKRSPGFYPSQFYLTASLTEVGQEREARAMAAEILKEMPEASLEIWRYRLPYKDKAVIDRLFDDLHKAGIPDKAPLRQPDKPSIAVLPFLNMSGDPEQEYFSDGMTEDLITDLSKVSGLFVIARNSVFTYKGKTVKVKQVGRELGIRYVLEGSVRKAGSRVRITAQLADANTGGHLWAERYDRELKDIFALQDEVTQKIVTALKVKLTKGEQDRLLHRHTDNLEAHDYILRGREYIRHFTQERNAQARRLFEKAIELDPKYAAAYVGLALTYLHGWQLGWSQDPKTLDRAFELALTAKTLDEKLPECRALLAHVYLWRKRHDSAIAEARKVIAFAPNNADGYQDLGQILTWAGRPEEAIGLVEKAMRLDPRYPFHYLWGLGHAQALTGRFQDAIATFNELLSRSQNFVPAHFYLAFMYSEMGRMDEARSHMAEVGRLSPGVSLEDVKGRLPYKDEAVLERVISAIKKAME